MNIAEVKATLRGPMVPVLTHYKSDLSIDHAAIRENVRTLVGRGLTRGQGVLLAGGAGGDFPMLTLDERKQVAKTVVETADGRTPVVVGAQDTHVWHCIEMARWAEEIGAYGIQLSPAYYYPANEETTWRVFEAVHEATRRIVLMVYNTHWEGYDMPLDLVARLSELPRCRSLKWSTPDSARYVRGVAHNAARMAVVDNQGLYVMNHLLGGAGFVTHLCTIWPEHELAIWKLLETGDYPAAQKKVTDVTWAWCDVYGRLVRATGAEGPAVKAALELCGRPGGPSRLPIRALSDAERRELRAVLVDLGTPDVK
ncbi:MAG: dihydrodipicolinate synthase family protein [Planctomycetes bacterium]|nr:dihydrodipicolinate synthase family protein [Planctomycetota bacterium]